MISAGSLQSIDNARLREQIENHPRAQDLLRAFLYPYGVPDHDFVLHRGQIMPLPDMAGGDVAGLLSGRVPVLAVGSNRAPFQLARKFAAPHDGDVLPVTFGWLDDHDVVYCAAIAGYGSIPATLLASPGTQVRVAVTWLTTAQLGHMHATESVPDRYFYRQIPAIGLRLDCAVMADHVGYYHSSTGWHHDDGAIYALGEIAARGRRHPARTQWQMIAHYAQRAGIVSLPDFILRVIDDTAFRNAIFGHGTPR